MKRKAERAQHTALLHKVLLPSDASYSFKWMANDSADSTLPPPITEVWSKLQ
jgi:hypothetical protein